MARATSCVSRYTEAAKRTRSFMRNGTLPAMAGNPPAEAAQPSGMNGMIVMVPMNAAHEPRAPRIPSRLYQNPRNKSSAKDHSDRPRNQLAPRTPNAGYNHQINGPLLIYGISTAASYWHHLWYPKNKKRTIIDPRMR